MSELTVTIGYKSDLKQAVQDINAVRSAIEQTRRVQAQTARQRREAADLDKRERDQSFARLSLDQQVATLQTRRNTLKQRIDQPGIPRSEHVQLAYQNSLKRTEGQLTDLQGRQRDEQATARQRALNQIQSEAARLAKQQRQEVLSRVPVETRINQLIAQRDRLNRFLGRKNLSDVRRSALDLRRRQVEGQLDRLQHRSRPFDMFKEVARDIPGVGRAISFLEGPLGRVSIAAAGVAGAIALMGVGLNKAVRGSQALSDLSAQSQIGKQRLQALAFAANATGTDFNLLTRSILDLKKNQGEALLKGNEEKLRAFKELGISEADLQSMSADDLFLKITEGFKGGQISAKQFAASMKVMGESSRQIMAGLQKNLGGLVNEFEKSGAAVSDGTTELLTRFGDDFDKMTATVKAWAKKLGVELAGGAITLGQLATAAIANVAAPFSDTAANLRDDLLTQRELAQMGGDDQDAIRKQEERLRASKDARKAKADKATADTQTQSDEQSTKAERMLRLEEQLAKAKFDSLEADEKRAELLKRIEATQSTINLLEAEGGDNAEAILQQRLKLIEAQNQLTGIDKTDKAQKSIRRDTDSLTRIGGFVGRNQSVDRLHQLARQQVDLLRQLNRRLDRPLKMEFPE